MANTKMNNKKYRRQKQRKTFPWLLVALGGGLLLVAAAIFFANQNSGDMGGGMPTISVDQNKIDYGYVKFGENRQFTVKVSNTGDGNLRFEDKPYIEVLEGC
jgi:hypothetical protein